MGQARTPKTEERLTTAVDWSKLVSIDKMLGDTKKDTRLLREMADEASEYLMAFKWCKRIRRIWFGWGVGGVCAVFFLEIEPSSKKVDRRLWVIVGDLPPAYLVVDASPSPLTALQNYVDLMQEWVDTVKRNRSVENCIRVNVPPTVEFANLLQRRLRFIRREFLAEPYKNRGNEEVRKKQRQRSPRVNLDG